MAILDLDQPEMDSAIKELLKSAQENGIDATKLELIGIECDVSSEESVVAAFEQIKKRFGRVDAVVASAGREVLRPHHCVSWIHFPKASWRTTLLSSKLETPRFLPIGSSLLTALRYPFDRARKLFDINVHGVYLTAREAAKIMIPNGGGSIILIASMSASVSTIYPHLEYVFTDDNSCRLSMSHK